MKPTQIKKMDKELIHRITSVCDDKIKAKGENVGLSFYAFFKNKNTEPDNLLTVAFWWIKTKQLDHFEKATKIKKLVLDTNPK